MEPCARSVWIRTGSPRSARRGNGCGIPWVVPFGSAPFGLAQGRQDKQHARRRGSGGEEGAPRERSETRLLVRDGV